MRTYLANIDCNNLLENKTATECWTCLKYEIEGITERFVPLRKQVKRSRKKHLSKDVIRKTAHKQVLWGDQVSKQHGIAASKGNRMLGLIKRTVTYKEKQLRVPVYKAIVRPHLKCCIQAWK